MFNKNENLKISKLNIKDEFEKIVLNQTDFQNYNNM